MPEKHVGLWKVWACLLLKKIIYFFERPVSSGSCQDLNARKIFKRGNVNGKKVKEWRKGKKKTLRGGGSSNEQMTNYIQSQQTIPEGSLEGSNVKILEHFEMKKRMWPTQNTESVNIEVCKHIPYYLSCAPL